MTPGLSSWSSSSRPCRNPRPSQNNPYTPIDPAGARLSSLSRHGPLALLTLAYGRKKSRGKWDTLVILLVMCLAVGISLSACKLPMPVPSPTPTETPTQPPATGTPTPGNNPGSNPTSTKPPTVTPTPCPPTPTRTPTPSPTPELEPWKTDTGYEAETGSKGYNPKTNRIEGWGTLQSERAREKKAERVYAWLCKSGGYWGPGCPDEQTVASLGLYLEGFTLLLERMAKGIRYRFGR